MKIKTHVKEIVSQEECYSEYLKSTNISKEKICPGPIGRDPDKVGLLCVLSCVEPCNVQKM